MLTLEDISLEKLHKGIKVGGGGGSIWPLPLLLTPCTQPIDLIFGTYNKLSLYFSIIEITWCVIGFHGNRSHINDVTSGSYLGFSNFQIFFIFELNTENSEKTTLDDSNLQNCKIHCKVVSI